jgi:hypothetical protein
VQTTTLDGRSVLDDADVLALASDEAEFVDGGGAVAEQPLPVDRVGPGLRDDLGAVEWADADLVLGDESVHHGRVDQAPFGE